MTSTIDDYLLKRGVSHSALEVLIADPLLYYHRCIARDVPFPRSDEMDFGSLVDDLLTGQAPRIALWEGGPVKNTKRGEDPRISTSKNTVAYREFVEANKGRLIVTQDDLDRAGELVAAVRNHQQAKHIVGPEGVEYQVDLDWTIPWTGGEMPCKGRMDGLLTLDDVAWDLKTTSCTSLEAVRKQAIGFGYHRKQAWYERGYLATRGRELRQFLFVSVCTVPKLPHVWVWAFDDFARAAADADLDLALADLQARSLLGDWERDDTKGVQTVGIKPYEISTRTQLELERRDLGA